MGIPVVSVVGHSGSGKTTLLERLIPELKRRGYRVAVVKHHPQPGLDLDEPGKDTWRLAQAGAEQVILVAPDQVMHRRRLKSELTLEQVAADIRDVDLILTEGYKSGNAPKVEVSRGEQHRELLSSPDELIAIVSDQHFEVDVAQFGWDDVFGLADLIARSESTAQRKRSRP